MDKSKKSDESRELVLETCLQTYFYDQLQSINRKSICPLPNEAIHYSSMVMDKFGESKKYFEVIEGKVREKTLGLKLLESSNLPKSGQKRVLREVGDTALFVCGYFSESLNKKIINTRYYQSLGRMAYSRLNAIVPKVYEVPSFFDLLSDSFHSLTMVMSLVSKHNNSEMKNVEPMVLFISDTNKIRAS